MPPPTPSWYPKDADEMVKKCNEENNINPQTKFDIYTDSPQLRAHLLCKAKATNIYTEDEGFHIDRMAYLFFSDPENNINDPVLQDCVNENKNISSHDERVYKTFRCIPDLDKNFFNFLLKVRVFTKNNFFH